MNINTFIKHLKAVDSAHKLDHVAEMAAFACEQAAQKRPNYDPLDALISVSMRTGWRALVGDILRAHNVLTFGKITSLDKDKKREWKGIEITHTLRPKASSKDPDTGARLDGKETAAAFALACAAIDTEAATDVVIEHKVAEAAEKAAKKKAAQQKKAKPEYWRQRLEKLAAEAAKAGFELEGLDKVMVKAMIEQVAEKVA